MKEPDTLSDRTSAERDASPRPPATARTPLAPEDDHPTRIQIDASLPDTAPEQHPRPHLPGYEILSLLGHGGMGIVYKATQLGLNRIVAVKVLPPHGRLTGEEWARFLTEAKLLARCAHPNIVQVHEFGSHEGVPFLTMEFVEGGSLATHIRSTPQAPREAAALIETLARAIHHAHQQGIVHRDLKPSNVLLDLAQTLKITDFGLARSVETDSALTRTGAVMGTPSYMAPEQALGRGDLIGPPVDVHALGAILYEMLTGRPPFKGANAGQTLEQVRTQEAVPPSLIVPAVPLDLETICLKCLEKDPASRYVNALELAEDLRRFQHSEPIKARPVSGLEKLGRWCRRHPSLAALYAVSLVAIVSLLTMGIGFLWHITSTRTELALAHAETERQEHEARERAWEAAEAELRATTHAYYRGLHTLRQRQLQGRPNWSEENLRDVTMLARRLPVDASVAELRTEAVTTLSAVDVGHPREVAPNFTASAVAFAPDGKLLALGQSKAQAFAICSVLLLDPDTGTIVQRVQFPPDLKFQLDRGVQDGTRSVVFSPDGHWLVVGTRSGRLHRWDLREKTPRCQSWNGHQAEVYRLVFCQGSLYSCSADHRVKRWDCASNWTECARFVGAQNNGFTDLVAGSSGWLAVVGDGALTILDAKTLMPRKPATPVKAEHLAVSPDEHTFFVAESPATLVLDAERLQVLRRARIPNEEDSPNPHLCDLQISPDGTLMTVASDERRYVDVWDVVANRRLVRLQVGGGWVRLAFRPDGQMLAVVADKKTLLYPLAGRHIQTTCALRQRRVYDVAWSSRGLYVFAGTASGVSELTHWPRTSQGLASTPDQATDVVPFGECRVPLTVNPRDSSVAVRADHRRVEWGTLGMAQQHTAHWENTNVLQFGPDGRLWAAIDTELRIYAMPREEAQAVWSNALTGKLTGVAEMWALAVGRTCVLAGGRDGLVRRFNTQAQLQATWPIAREPLTSVALGRDQALAAIGTVGGELVLLRVADGTVLTRLRAHQDSVDSLLWLTPDRLITSARDGTVSFWRLERPAQGALLTELFTLKLDGPVRRIALSPEGRCLAVCVDGERAVRLWHLETLENRLRELALDPGRLTGKP